MTWDPYLSPSTDHGVTSVVMGNCGVGFAPVHADKRDWLISVMEGVEDIPGTVLAEGIDWQWESFPEYLDALERMPRALDVGAQIPHSALRTFVMGERGITHDEATPADIQAMIELVDAGLRAGALGFSTSRTIIHKYQGRKYPPGTFASPDEILGLARVMGKVGHGVFQMTANHYQMEIELPWMRQLARDNQLPVAFALVQTDQTPDTWIRLLAALDETHAAGIPLYGAVAGRPAGILMAWLGSTHPFMAHPRVAEDVDAAWPDKLARLRDPAVRAQLTDMQAMAGATRHDSRLSYLTRKLPQDVRAGRRAGLRARAGKLDRRDRAAQRAFPLEVAYDMLMADDGKGIIYFPSFNYAYNDLRQLHTELQHPRTMMSLADGGAHCGYICDVSMPTYMLTHWARDRQRGPTLPLELMVQRQTRDTAAIYGMKDRGLLQARLSGRPEHHRFRPAALAAAVRRVRLAGRRATPGADR